MCNQMQVLCSLLLIVPLYAQTISELRQFVSTNQCSARHSSDELRVCGSGTTWSHTRGCQPGCDTEKVSRPETSPTADLNTFNLLQVNFTQGTLRLKEPGVYQLQENIEFEPTVHDNFWPHPNLTQYNEPQFRLGFFAAITMEGDDIHLDLNGHTIKQSKVHALQQRFFAIIELADRPFIPKQGPGSFGANITSCENCSIRNGTIGLSSHHGIHGNRVSNITISNLKFQDYEVAAISINRGHGVLIEDCQLMGQRTDIPVRATYSAGRFLLKFWDQLKGKMDSNSSAYKNISSKATGLRHKMHLVLEAVNHSQPINEAAFPEFALPSVNGSTFVDGNAYGITIHGDGVLIGSFQTSLFNANATEQSSDITISNVTINNTVGNVHEVVTLKHPTNKKLQVDVAGSVLRIHDILHVNKTYKSDSLHDLRFELAFWCDENGGNDTDLLAAAKSTQMGTFNIALETAQWARDGSDIAEWNETHYSCNGDSMNHRQKGVIGIFIQQTQRALVQNVKINGVKNYGREGASECGNYRKTPGDDQEDHDNVGYTGAQSRGIAITTSSNVVITDTSIAGVESNSSTAYGIHVFNNVRDFCSKNLQISDTLALSGGLNDPGLALQRVYGKEVWDMKTF